MGVVLAITIEQVAFNKLTLLLKMKIQNTQTLQLFTNIIKTEIFYKSYENAKQKGRFRDQVIQLKWARKRKQFKEEKLDLSRECLIRENIQNEYKLLLDTMKNSSDPISIKIQSFLTDSYLLQQARLSTDAYTLPSRIFF